MAQTAGLDEGLQAGVEGEGDGVGEGHAQHVRPDVPTDDQPSPHPSWIQQTFNTQQILLQSYHQSSEDRQLALLNTDLLSPPYTW